VEVDDFVPISGLQQVVFCARQAALIHVEQLWADDGATAEGTALHERVDEPGTSSRPGLRTVRAVPLVSRLLRVRGRADMVELHEDAKAPRGARPVPVEMKRGRLKHERADMVQLCAQAICLEEMFGVSIPRGWLSYAGSHRRRTVDFDASLREATRAAADELRGYIVTGRIPPAKFIPAKCGSCSLDELCLPQVTGERDRSGGPRPLLSLITGGK
jgi:CRISPR-associated exonuclease Cas4